MLPQKSKDPNDSVDVTQTIDVARTQVHRNGGFIPVGGRIAWAALVPALTSETFSPCARTKCDVKGMNGWVMTVQSSFARSDYINR